LGGASSDQIANTLAIIIDASREALADGKRVNEPVIIEVMTQGLWQRLETSIMVGTGADDTSSGLITGLYSDNTITSVNAGAGNVTVAQLQREDFTRCIGAISPGALMRTENCVWFISPTFIPSLLSIKAGPSGQFLLKTPSETGSDYWMLCGFRVVWTGGSPSTDGAGKQVACFANTNGYAVPIREQMELMGSESGAKFSSNIRQIRALMRCMAFTRDAASLAVLKTAAL
jgi:HK97 family phage major capsid protein